MDLLPLYLQVFHCLWQLGRPGQLFVGHQLSNLTKLSASSSLVNRLVTPELVLSIYQDLMRRADGKAGQGRESDMSLDRWRAHWHLLVFQELMFVEKERDLKPTTAAAAVAITRSSSKATKSNNPLALFKHHNQQVSSGGNSSSSNRESKVSLGYNRGKVFHAYQRLNTD